MNTNGSNTKGSNTKGSNTNGSNTNGLIPDGQVRKIKFRESFEVKNAFVKELYLQC